MIAAPQTRENHTALIIEKLCNDTNVFTEQPQEAIVKPMEETLTFFEPSNSKCTFWDFLQQSGRRPNSPHVSEERERKSDDAIALSPSEGTKNYCRSSQQDFSHNAVFL